MTRYPFFGINDLGRRCLRWLTDRGDPPVALITEPCAAREVGRFELGLSIGYRHILKADCLALFRRGIVNLHPSLLPYNRGSYPNVWPLLDGTPAGVTLHFMDEGVDTGPIIAQRQVPVEPWDTAESLYHRLEAAGFDLFTEWWPRIRAGEVPRMEQRHLVGTLHYARELEVLDWLEMTPQVRRVINQLRARTFAGHVGVRYRDGDQVIDATINLNKVE